MLQISWRTEYGLLFLAALARNKPKIYVPLKTLAQSEQLPYRFLSQIATALKKQGIVGSKEGSQGGYYLKRHPADITFNDVVSTLEASEGLVDCQSIQGCPKAGLCSMRPMWQRVQFEVADVLEKHTVAELI